MLGMLRGMFAFALWDGRKRSMLLARDPFGIKPLYYADDGKTLRVASQVKALLCAPVDTAPEPAGHAGFYLWGSVPAPWTLYRGIRNLQAGHFMQVTEFGAGQPKPYCLITDILSRAAAEPAQGSRQEALEHISEALRDSVKAHMVSDVPVGIFLSGGLDSAMITSMVSESGVQPRTLTLGFAEFAGTPNDEAPLAEALAGQFGARHSAMAVHRADFEGERRKLLGAMDQPSIDGVNTWFVARAAAAQGMKVALSGLGGDELFGSYPSFRDVPRLARIAGPWSRVPGLGAGVRRLSEPLLRRVTSPKYAGLIEYGGTLGGAYLLRRGLYMPWELPRLMDPDMARAGWRDLQAIARLDEVQSHFKGASREHFAISALEMSWYMRNQLLADADWAGMAQSFEIRVPFLDIPLLKATAPWFAAHPSITKRDIAATVAPTLRDSVLNKPKTGFSVPVREWLGQPLGKGSRGLRSWARHVHAATPFNARPPAKRVLLLATDAYGGHGGIAYYNRCLTEAVAAIPEVAEIIVVPRVQRFETGKLPAKVRFLVDAAGRKRRYVSAVARLINEPFDLVICGHIHLLSVAAPFALLKRAPLVLQVHGIDAWQQPKPLSRFWLRSVSAVWSVSAVTRDRMNQWAGLPLSRYSIIPNAVHMDHYGMAPRRADLVSRHNLEGKTVIMTMARLAGYERYKGIDEVMEAMPELLRDVPALTYMVIGDGDDQARLEAKSQSLGLADKVIFTGFVDEKQKAEYLRLADAFVLPGRGEGFGVVYLEALACGIPVVGSKLDGSREALREGSLGELADPKDLSSVRECILRALAKPKGVPAELRYYDWPAFAGRVNEAFGKQCCTRELA
jgi:asparagine synthase (glutamine-hydrolysing)